MEIGLTLMLVGMVTVFAVLLIIIYLSKGLIALVNKIAPEEEVKHKQAPAAQAVSPEIMQVIQQAVSQITGGKGTVAKVEKI